MNDRQRKQITEAQSGLASLSELLTTIGDRDKIYSEMKPSELAAIAKYIGASDIAEELDVLEIASEVADKVASNIDCSEVAYNLDISDIAAEIDASDVADYIRASDIACEIDCSEIASEIDTQTISGSVADMMMSDGAFVEQLSMKMLKAIGWQSQSDRDAHYNHQLSQENEIEQLRGLVAELRDHLRAAAPSSPRV